MTISIFEWRTGTRHNSVSTFHADVSCDVLREPPGSFVSKQFSTLSRCDLLETRRIAFPDRSTKSRPNRWPPIVRLAPAQPTSQHRTRRRGSAVGCASVNSPLARVGSQIARTEAMATNRTVFHRESTTASNSPKRSNDRRNLTLTRSCCRLRVGSLPELPSDEVGRLPEPSYPGPRWGSSAPRSSVDRLHRQRA